MFKKQVLRCGLCVSVVRVLQEGDCYVLYSKLHIKKEINASSIRGTCMYKTYKRKN